MRAVLEENQDLLEQIKLYLLYDLSLCSALLETNSYHVALTDHRVIPRFLPCGPGGRWAPRRRFAVGAAALGGSRG